MTKKAYARAGVDVDLGNTVKERIHGRIRETHGPEVLGKIGGFGGLFAPNFSGMREPVLVASVDGVGTKLKIAFAMNRHDTVGADLVNHCVNDIAVLGARPLFFLDYIGAEKLEPRVFDQNSCAASRAPVARPAVRSSAARPRRCPDMYRKGEYDLAGCIVGVVDRAADHRWTQASNLATRFSGCRRTAFTRTATRSPEKSFSKKCDSSRRPGCRASTNSHRRRTHARRTKIISHCSRRCRAGMIQGTGAHHRWRLGRQYPACPAKELRRRDRYAQLGRACRFSNPPGQGKIDRAEMYQVFNMGIGMAAIVSPADAKEVARILGAKADRSDRARQRQDETLVLSEIGGQRTSRPNSQRGSNIGRDGALPPTPLRMTTKRKCR